MAAVQNFPIVGIGASAGGLDAFKNFIKSIPADSGLAYVIIQHLEATRESILPEILARSADIPVIEIIQNIQVVPNHIYVIPANNHLTVEGGILKLSPRAKVKRNLPIDVFFTSLAEAHQHMAVGVVLSGTGSDGTLGLKAIQKNGGLTFAQLPKTATYKEMPQSAIDAGVAEFVLPPQKMPAKLLKIIQSDKNKSTTDYASTENDEDAFQEIIYILHQSSGVDFTYYKQTTIRRRIQRRMSVTKKASLHAYAKLLKADEGEREMLFQDMLIPVTSFFRDPEYFDLLGDKIFPEIFNHKSNKNPIRIWAAGCSTGEEAYSLAIKLCEFLDSLPGKPEYIAQQIYIFASDISISAIETARAGIYKKSDLTDVPDTLLQKYFTKNGRNFQVSKQIREMCLFAVHNFLIDPPFSKIDLISCRNVLIYMDSFLQKKALTTFHYALNDSGILMLGKSETTGPAAELFSIKDKHYKIFTRKNFPGQFLPMVTEPFNSRVRPKAETLSGKGSFHPPLHFKKTISKEIGQTNFRKSAEDVLLSRYTPASVIINEANDVVHIHGQVHPFLEPSQGKPTFNLFKMAQPSLAFELRNVFRKVKSTNQTVSRHGLPIKNGKNTLIVNFEIVPLSNMAEPHYLVVFHKETSLSNPPLKKEKINDAAQQRIDMLEKELEQNLENMRAITEVQETINEELQSANEELLSSNEEMQSMNEEMETSKEELQSTNEELIIVNQELNDRQQQIEEAKQYSEAIIATLREPLAVLDRSLHIKTANAAFYKKFNCKAEETEGRLIYEMKNGLFDNDSLRSLLDKILPEKKKMIDYEILINLPPYGERTLLLNAWHMQPKKSNEKLIILALEDITEIKIVEERKKNVLEVLKSAYDSLQLLNKDLKLINESKDKFIYIISHDLRNPLSAIITMSETMKNMSEFSTDEITSYSEIIHNSSINLLEQLDELVEWSIQKEQLTHFNPLVKSLYTFVENAKELNEENARLKNIIINNTIDKNIKVMADPFLLNSIFHNLLSNSIKYTPESGSISISAKVSTNNFIEISIEDSGVGMTKQQTEELFSNEVLRKYEDGVGKKSGLGLLLVIDFVRKHGGKIWVKSTIGKGTTTYFTLPMAKEKISKK